MLVGTYADVDKDYVLSVIKLAVELSDRCHPDVYKLENTTVNHDTSPSAAPLTRY
jgi:hypothetical protein